MRPLLITLIILAMTTINGLTRQSQPSDISKIKTIEHQLSDVMEIIDINLLKIKLNEVEENYKQDQNEINKVRLGILYHETALNLSFISKTEYKDMHKRVMIF